MESLNEQSYAFDVGFTLSELEWRRVAGPTGLGRRLLEEASRLGQAHLPFGPLAHRHSGQADLFEFELGDEHVRIRLDHDVPHTSSLLFAVRRLFDGVNRSLRRSYAAWRYVVVREEAAAGRYRLVLLPVEVLESFNRRACVVAGLSPEDFEASGV